MNVTLVGHGEYRHVTHEKESSSRKVTRLHPKGTRAYLDLSFNGSASVRIHITSEQYEKEILPKLFQGKE